VKGVEGDITSLVGGAKSAPVAGSKSKQAGSAGGEGGYTDSLLDAKRRAREKMRQTDGAEKPNG
jgi:hypothetical protein